MAESCGFSETSMPSKLSVASLGSPEASPRLEHLPILFVLPAHLSVDELEGAEQALVARGATLTYEISEAKLILGAIESSRRARFELNTRGIRFEDASHKNEKSVEGDVSPTKTARKRAHSDEDQLSGTLSNEPTIHGNNIVNFVRLAWLHDCIKEGKVLELQAYVIYTIQMRMPAWSKDAAPVKMKITKLEDNTDHSSKRNQNLHLGDSRRLVASEYEGRRFRGSRGDRASIPETLPQLTRENTSEHEDALQNPPPPPPAWVQDGKVFACERITLANSPNSDFLDQLEKIRLARTLIEDQIGIRAYSTSIASLAAYPYKLSDAREVERLPGCDQKIAVLFREYQSTGHVAASDAIDEDPTLCVIRDFYNIWGVGARTAREWYFERGWRDHDDIIQYGWNDLTRVQQIGLKYFEEFQLKIPRAEVELIASIVHRCAKALTDERMTCTIVGGYRRGKSESGDVDIILSHPEEASTHYFIQQLVTALEDSGWITHTLTLSETNSQRDQQPLGLRVDSSKGGFDTLDKALLVWQDPDWTNKSHGESAEPPAKNPNVHRRVDIIVSPWRTVGCAIAGWSSGTTFQRDLRRYAKHKHGWKFDSSGVRDRKTGRWIDLENWTHPAARAKTPLEAERRVFEGLGLEYREPYERCTR